MKPIAYWMAPAVIMTAGFAATTEAQDLVAQEPVTDAGAAAIAPEAGVAASVEAQSAAADPAGTTEAAQPAATEATRSGIGIEEIIVTAQRRSENVNDVPIAISAFSGDDLKALGIEDARDLAAVVPGFTAADGGGNAPIYTLRGVGFNDTTYTATSTVGVYVDEVSLPYSIMTKGASLDLERVEVLKGPQGILYGRNTTGGAINYIARKPTSAFEAGVTQTVGSYLTSSTEAYVSGNLVGDLNGRLAVKNVVSGEGWQYSNTRPDDTLGKKNKQAFRGTLEWEATDTLKLRFVGDGWWDRSDAQARQAIGIRQQNGADPTGVLFLPPQTRNYPVLSRNSNPRAADWPSELDWKLNDRYLSSSLRADWNLSDRTTFTAIASQLRVDSDGSELPGSGLPYNAFEQILYAHIETSSLELRLAGVLGEDDQFKWQVGGNVSKDRGYEQHELLADFQSALFPDPITGRSLLTNRLRLVGASNVEQAAAFVNAGWEFVDSLTWSVGARYTQQKQHYIGCSSVSPDADYDLLSTTFTGLSAANAAAYLLATGQAGDPSIITTGDCFSISANGNADALNDTLDEDNVSLRTSLDWKSDADTLYYASVSRGYKAGAFPVLSASNKDQLLPVKQEEVLAFEIGNKATILDRQLHTNFATYFYEYSDKQLLTKLDDAVFGPLPVLQNAPKSQVYGVEIDAQYAPNAIPGLFAALSGAYTHTEIKKFVGRDSAGEEYDFAGRPFNFAPKYQGTVLVNYSHPLNDAIDLVLGADYRYSSTTSSALDPDPAFKHESYGLLGARIGIKRGGDWDLTAFGTNLTNEVVPITVLAYGDTINRYVGEPRMVGLTFSYYWN